MVRFLIDDTNTIRVEQATVAPAVYFDHWALRNISEDPALKSRVTGALNSRGGTLMLSWLNLAEFSKVTDSAQAQCTESLVEDILPNVFFLEINPFTVIEKEDQLLAGGQPTAPHADTGFLKAFIALTPTSARPFTARNLFRAVTQSEFAGEFDALANTIVERSNALRDSMVNDATFEKRVKRLPSGPEIQHGTRYLLRELARSFLVDRTLSLTRNHAIDLLHSVVPVAYCDLVLLDKHWETQVEKVRSRFADADMNVPLARVYSRRMNGMERFLSTLESSDI